MLVGVRENRPGVGVGTVTLWSRRPRRARRWARGRRRAETTRSPATAAPTPSASRPRGVPRSLRGRAARSRVRSRSSVRRLGVPESRTGTRAGPARPQRLSRWPSSSTSRAQDLAHVVAHAGRVRRRGRRHARRRRWPVDRQRAEPRRSRSGARSSSARYLAPDQVDSPRAHLDVATWGRRSRGIWAGPRSTNDSESGRRATRRANRWCGSRPPDSRGWPGGTAAPQRWIIRCHESVRDQGLRTKPSTRYRDRAGSCRGRAQARVPVAPGQTSGVVRRRPPATLDGRAAGLLHVPTAGGRSRRSASVSVPAAGDRVAGLAGRRRASRSEHSVLTGRRSRWR